MLGAFSAVSLVAGADPVAAHAKTCEGANHMASDHAKMRRAHPNPNPPTRWLLGLVVVTFSHKS